MRRTRITGRNANNGTGPLSPFSSDFFQVYTAISRNWAGPARPARPAHAFPIPLRVPAISRNCTRPAYASVPLTRPRSGLDHGSKPCVSCIILLTEAHYVAAVLEQRVLTIDIADEAAYFLHQHICFLQIHRLARGPRG